MRSTLRTPFWQAAYHSLPKAVRQRHLAQLESAERWSLALDAAVSALSRVKGALASLLGTTAKPRSAH